MSGISPTKTSQSLHKKFSNSSTSFQYNSQPHEDVFFTAAHLRRLQLHESAHTLSPPYHVRDLRENELRNYPRYLCPLHCKRTLSFEVVWLYTKRRKNISGFEKFFKNFFVGERKWNLIFFKDVAYNNLKHLGETVF